MVDEFFGQRSRRASFDLTRTFLFERGFFWPGDGIFLIGGGPLEARGAEQLTRLSTPKDTVTVSDNCIIIALNDKLIILLRIVL